MNRGIEKYLLDIYKEIDKSNFQFDFLTPQVCYNDEFRMCVSKLGGKIIELNGADNKVLNKLIPIKIWLYLIKNKYEIVHIHTGNVLLMGLFAVAAKLAGIKRVYVHAHNSADMKTGLSVKNYKNYIAEFLMGQFCDGFYGCSFKAVQFMFSKQVVTSKKYKIIPNGIDVLRYRYDSAARKKIRRELGLTEECLLGSIGAFVQQKNHLFLIKVFNAIKKKKKDGIKLLLVGEGALEQKIRQQCKMLGIDNDVIFYGTTDQIPAVLSAMDILVMPSLYEGFPVVGVEAQAAGLRCLMSDHITNEIKLIDSLELIPIDNESDIDRWAKVIITTTLNGEEERLHINDVMQKSAYQISNSAKIFESIYSE